MTTFAEVRAKIQAEIDVLSRGANRFAEHGHYGPAMDTNNVVTGLRLALELIPEEAECNHLWVSVGALPDASPFCTKCGVERWVAYPDSKPVPRPKTEVSYQEPVAPAPKKRLWRRRANY